MRLLFYQWHSFMNEGVIRGLQELQLEYDTFFYQLANWEENPVFVDKLSEQLKNGGYDCVFSINYVPLISNLCEEKEIRYVAWVYDSPIHIRDLSSLSNSCNEIYFFDRGQAEEYNKQGIDAHYMPLAVDTIFWKEQISKKSSFASLSDISFVGQIYETQYSYFVGALSEYLRGYMEGIVCAQEKIYGGYLIPELVTEELLQKMNQEYEKIATDDFQMGRRELEFLLACETTHRERLQILTLLGNHFDVHWYTADKETAIANVTKHPYVDYSTQMPVVFSKSKINLNISLKTIRTGIPLRALDIMGCGGFLLSNFQVELAEYFVPGQECVFYDGLEDLYQKAAYYLTHDTEREQIAEAGYERVKRDFTFRERLSRML